MYLFKSIFHYKSIKGSRFTFIKGVKEVNIIRILIYTSISTIITIKPSRSLRALKFNRFK